MALKNEFTCETSEGVPASLPATPFSHYQSGEYPGLLKRYGKRPLWLVVSDSSGETVAAWLLFFSPGNALHPPRHPLSRMLDSHCHCVHGPTVSSDLSSERRGQVFEVLLRKLRRLLRRHRPVSNRFLLDSVMPPQDMELWSRAAQAAGFRTDVAHTYAVWLPESEEALFKKIKSDRRTKVRKAEKQNPKFEEVRDLEALRLYHQVRLDTLKRNGFAPVPFEHFKDNYEELHASGIYRVFLARFGDRIGAGQVAFVWNRYVNLSGVSIAQWVLEEKVPANDYLQWNVLLWALKNGCEIVDFVGAQPDNPDPKIKAIDAFKSRWGTELCESLTLRYPMWNWRGPLSHLALKIFG